MRYEILNTSNSLLLVRNKAYEALYSGGEGGLVWVLPDDA